MPSVGRDAREAAFGNAVEPPAGYADPSYAAALSEIGAPRRLQRSGGSVLVRAIGGSGSVDAMGPYPLFSCPRWEALAEDIDDLRDELVSLVVVPDPFGSWTTVQLEASFPDRCVPFKEHFVVDLSRPPLESATRHHRRDAARALRRTQVAVVDDAPAFLDDWEALYRTLIARHDVRGPAVFSRASFAHQLRVRGLVAFRAERDGALVGGALWFVDGAVAHYHLAAYSDKGYEQGVSYALVATALRYFAGQGVEWAALGAGAGLQGRASDGLSRFKAGWATGTRTAYLCGRILDKERYRELTRSNSARSEFFPAYRA